MNSLQTILYNVSAGVELSPAQVRELSALVSLGFNTRGRIDRDYELRSDILAAMPLGQPLRVKEIQARNAKVDDYSVQKVAAALKALVWAGVVERQKTDEVEKVVIQRWVGWHKGNGSSPYKDEEILVPIIKFVRII